MVGMKRKISEVEDAETQPIPSIKNLASSDSKDRRQALSAILTHFDQRPSTSALTSTQCQQIWRGFHVAVYMHDSKNAISVQNLISTLADTFKLIRSKDQQNEAQLTVNDTASPGVKTLNGTNRSAVKDDGDDDEEFNGFDDDADDRKSAAYEDEIDTSWLSIYTAAFWTTMIREWPTIDSHRMNKYLLLIRMVTRSLFTIMVEAQLPSPVSATTKDLTITKSESRSKPAPKPKSKSKSTSDKSAQIESPNENNQHQHNAQTHISTRNQLNTLLRSQTSLLSTYPLNPRDTKIPNGLRIHMLDIYTDELEKVIITTTTTTATKNTTATSRSSVQYSPLKAEEFLTLLKAPIQRIAETGLARIIRIKAKEQVNEFESRITSNLLDV